MKIDIVSDVHLEFGTYIPSNPNKSDVLIMAGDIIPIYLLANNKKYIKYFEQCGKLYKHIIYIFGNHEYYNGDIRLEFDNAQKWLGHIDNLRIVNNKVVKIDDVSFMCGTMWTDCNKEDPLTMLQLIQGMNDFRVIKDSSKASMYGGIDYLTPEDTVIEHKLFKKFLISALNNNHEKCIVVTHHSPSLRSIPEEYRRDYHMNGGYTTNLDEFIMNRPYIKAWIYGHTHSPNEFMVGETMLINNARGYVKYERMSDLAEPYLPKTIEIQELIIMNYTEATSSCADRNKKIDMLNKKNQDYNNDSEIADVIKNLAESVAFLSELLNILSVKLEPVLKLDNPSEDGQELKRNSILQSTLAIQINSINSHLTESAIKRVQTILFDLAL